MNPQQQAILVDDIFSLNAVDPEGKKFDRVSRVKGLSENYGMDLMLDVNVELYPVKVGDKINLALAKTISLDGVTPSDEAGYRPDAGPTLADKYEYVMYGKVFKFEKTPSNKLAMYISYGGLLMRLEGEPRYLKGFAAGSNIYLLARKL